MVSEFRLRTNIDFAEVRRRFRCEYGSAVHSEAEISATLTGIQRDLDDCDAEARRLRARIGFLQRMSQDLKAYETCLQFLRSPIRRLPNETLLRIIDYTCEINEVTSKKLEAMPALSISGVCSRWRSLARSSPSVWTGMRLHLLTTPPNLPTFPIVKLYIDLSQTSPLVIELSAGCLDMMPHHRTLCDTLIACKNRWQSLHFAVGKSKPYEALVRDVSQFPTLKHLELPYACLPSVHLNMYKHAPKLQSFSLCRVHHFDSSSEFPWMQLISLDIAQCDNGTRGLFEKCTNLKDLRFCQPQGISMERCSPDITVPSVQTLVLSLRPVFSGHNRLANLIFSSFVCPSLTTLRIEGTQNFNHDWPRKEVSSFVSHSSSHLMTLSLESIPLSDNDLMDLLHRLPSLLHLTIHDPHEHFFGYTSPITTQFTQSLHPFRDANPMVLSSALVPNLQSLSLVFSGSDFDDRTFVDMVSLRWFPESYVGYGLTNSDPRSRGRTVCLRSVVMRFTNRVVDEDIYRPLKYLEEEGMRVVVNGKGS